MYCLLILIVLILCYIITTVYLSNELLNIECNLIKIYRNNSNTNTNNNTNNNILFINSISINALYLSNELLNNG